MEPPKTRTRNWLAIGLVAALAWAIFLATSAKLRTSEGLEAPQLEPSAVARPAEFRWTLMDLEGKSVDFAKFRGRPILLNVWATWCPPCLKEMPSIANLAANPSLKEKGVVFLCVSVDKSPETLQGFMKDKSWGMTILQSDPNSVPPVFKTEVIPATFLIAPNGQIVSTEVGSAQWDDPTVVKFLEQLARPSG
jgi:thiol-disulfide isomerase/thioredoxin